jgi:hypothetical protein
MFIRKACAKQPKRTRAGHGPPRNSAEGPIVQLALPVTRSPVLEGQLGPRCGHTSPHACWLASPSCFGATHAHRLAADACAC